MSNLKSKWLITFILCNVWLSLNGLNAAESLNKDFWVINKNNEIESLEQNDYYFTWLGCASCLMIEEKVDLSNYVTLPLIARPDWRPAAKVQVALQMLSVEPSIQSKFHQQVLNDSVDVKSIDAMSALLVNLGLVKEELEEALTSKELFKKIADAEIIAKQYDIQYVPTVVVKGKYATDAKRAGTVAEFLRIMKTLESK